MISRRSLLLGSAAAALIAARAGAGWLPLAASTIPVPPPLGGNGGLSQLNFNTATRIDGAYPFINFMKLAQGWSYISLAEQPPPTELADATGYPTVIAHGGLSTNLMVPNLTQYSGQYVLKVTGTGNWNVTCGGLTSTQAAARVVSTVGLTGGFTIGGANGLQYQLKINSGTGITDIAFYRLDEETRFNAGEIFGALFISVLQAGNPGVLRFMQWQLNNTTNVRYWADRKPVAYFSYNADQYRSDWWAGLTSSIGDAYSVGAPSGWAGLVDKAAVTLRFDADTTSFTPTLNVGGTGAKIIRGPQGALLFGSQMPNSALARIATLVYDQDLDVWIKMGGDTDKNYVYLRNGVPVETMLTLCKKIGAHPWFCAPNLALDPQPANAINWLYQLATYVKANTVDDASSPWMIPRFEVVPNECWNTAGDYNSAVYGGLKANAHWGVSAADVSDWPGQVGSTGGQILNAVYGGSPGAGTKYHAISGVQTNGVTPSAQNAVLASTAYVAAGGGGLGAAAAAKFWVSHVCVANYWGHTLPTASSTVSSVTGSIAGTTLTITAATLTNDKPGIGPGCLVTGSGVAAGTYITDRLTGSAETTGTYTVNDSQTVASESLTISNTFASAVAAYAAVADAPSELNIATKVVDSAVLDGTGSDAQHIFSIPRLNTLWGSWKTWASGFGVSGLCCYEGGWSLKNVNGDTPGKTLNRATKFVASLATQLTTVYDQFVAAGGVFPSCYAFSNSGDPAISNTTVWNIFDPDIYATPSTQWAAITTFNN